MLEKYISSAKSLLSRTSESIKSFGGRFKKSYISALISTFIAGGLLYCGDSREIIVDNSAQKPNVLFISLDDVCSYGMETAATPNLDNLAEKGVYFTRAYCNTPACLPSRNNILTGLNSFTTGIYSNVQSREYNIDKWEDNFITNRFKYEGYKSLVGGKIYHGLDLPQKLKDNLDDFFLPEDELSRGELEVDYDGIYWGDLPINKDRTTDAQVADWASAKLKEKHEKPFFLAIGFDYAHTPWFVLEEYLKKYDTASIPKIKEDDLEDIPVGGVKLANPAFPFGNASKISLANRGEAIKHYLASIELVDSYVGRVLETLNNSDYKENTIVVLWSDHGYHLGEKQHFGKFTLWENALRVPLIVVNPKNEKQGNCQEPVSLEDIYPTLFELCGLESSVDLDGKSLADLIRNPEQEAGRNVLATCVSKRRVMTPAEIVEEHYNLNRALISKKWKYIRYWDGQEELYNLVVDPNEWVNLVEITDEREFSFEQLAEFRKEARKLSQKLEKLTPDNITNLEDRLSMELDIDKHKK